jgi:nucleotide-binding universal stress UspA family protein
MIHRILVGLDGSPLAERALPHAAVLAEALGAELVLMRVLEDDAKSGAPIDPVAWRLRRSEAAAYLRRVAAQVADGVTTVKTELEEGNAAEQIVDFARARDVDLVVIGSHGEGGTTQFGLCSTAQKVIAEVRRSVLLVQCGCGREDASPEPARYRRMIVPVDGSRRAEWAVCLAATLAYKLAAEILLVCVVPVPATPVQPPLDAETQDLVDRLVERGRRWAEDYVEGLRNRLVTSDLEVRTLVLVSPRVDQCLYQILEQHDASLVVASAHGASGEADWPYGSIASKLLTQRAVPVLMLQDQPMQKLGAQETESPADDSRYARQAG